MFNAGFKAGKCTVTGPKSLTISEIVLNHSHFETVPAMFLRNESVQAIVKNINCELLIR